MGKLDFASKINKEAFRSVLTCLWRPLGNVGFKEIQDHLWIFEFSDIADKEKVLRGWPWSFDRTLIVLTYFFGCTPPSHMAFTHSPFWIQVHDLYV